ncbi:MAG: SLC13 family permease [Haloferacaceae archaeon]
MAATAIPDMVVVFALVAAAIVLFVTEALSPDTTAIAVVVALAVLEPFTHVPAADAISGFSNPATVTVVAMYVLSAGVETTGVIRRLGDALARFVGRDAGRLLGVTVGVTGPLAGVVNNTPVVAVFLPMVVDLADRVHVSPSKLLIPLSYASMLGGTLTLVGTATNLVASDLSAQLIGHPFSMFEFTPLGVVVLVVGTAYLLTVGQRLLPERVRALDLTREFAMDPYLWRLFVREDSPLVGTTIEGAFAGDDDLDLEILQVVRGERSFVAPGTDQEIRARDRLVVRADEATARTFADRMALRTLPRASVTEAELDRPEGRGILVEAVVRPESPLLGGTIADAAFRDRYRATVLAVRRGGTVVHEGLSDLELAEGDGLLLHARRRTIAALRERDELVVVQTSGTRPEAPEPSRDAKAPLALGIVAAVVGVAAVGLLPIVIAALGGVVAMIVGGVVRPREAYDAVHWEVIFLLAGVIPLGLALQRTGGAEFLGGLLVGSARVLPPIAVLALVYLLTTLLANVITPVASVVLMLPVAVDTAVRLDANAFAFVLAATFAATSAFMTPIGYQTNLMVYSPGGYRFSDYLRVGAPLQALLAVTVTLGIAAFWGLAP